MTLLACAVHDPCLKRGVCDRVCNCFKLLKAVKGLYQPASATSWSWPASSEVYYKIDMYRCASSPERSTAGTVRGQLLTLLPEGAASGFSCVWLQHQSCPIACPGHSVLTGTFLLLQSDSHCSACGKDNSPRTLLCCDSCPRVYHLSCLCPPLKSAPRGDWFCEHCVKAQSLQQLERILASRPKQAQVK